MSRLLACLLLLAFSESAASSAPTPPRAPALTWVFDTHEDKQLIPHGKVFLKVGTRRVLIEPKAEFLFQPVGRADYKQHKVPVSALAACSGWFAGGGEDMYVIQRRNSLRVYRRWTDEQAPEFHYKLIRTITLPSR